MMFKAIQEIVNRIIGVKRIALDTDFIRDLSLDSFDIINIIISLEERYKITIPVRDVWGINTVRDAIDYLESRGAKEPPEAK
jgi:acyl carrier protein